MRRKVQVEGDERSGAGGKLLVRGLLLTVTDVAMRGAGVIVALLIARFFGPTQYGFYTIASALVALALLATGIGFEQEFTRRASLDRRVLLPSLRLNVAAVCWTGIATFLLLGLVLSFGIYPPPVPVYTLLLAVALLLSRLHLPFRHYVIVVGRPERAALLQGVATLLVVSTTVLLIWGGAGLETLIVAQVAINGAVLAIWWRVFHGGAPEPWPKRDELLTFMRLALPYGISNVVWVAYFNMDSLILSLLRTEEEVGVYGAVFRIVGVAYIFGNAITSAFTPLLFSSFASDRREFSRHVRHLVGLLVGLGSVVCTALYLAAPLLPRVLGPGYSGGVPIMQCLALAALARFLNYGLCETLTTSGRQIWRVRLEIMLLLVNLVANLVLIPRFGGLGAALACLIAELALLSGVTVLSIVEKRRRSDVAS